ncbi:MAG: pseudouridine synthase [Crocinitomicaceae bacterium]|nr:pseudouridine synthase [Crocinitomicaceae bacterium]MDG2440320.1 pseudouridine synthase [Crocinitomicaceae bacterium]
MGRGRDTNAGRSGGRGNDTKKKSSQGKSTSERKNVTARDKGKYIDFKDRAKKGDPLPTFGENVRLNKYLSNAGVCSRREADVLIQTGLVAVNGEVVTEMGFKVSPTDEVKYDGGTIAAQKKQYVLLNKPKGFVTSMDDPFGRKNAMTLVAKACKENVFPIGRLGKDTTGLVLFTNDSDLEKKLMHPKHRAGQLFHVALNRKMKPEHLAALTSGVLLEDGTTKFSKAEFVSDTDSREIGIEFHSGKNQIVQRALESLGYAVVKMDRVTYSGLTKKDLPRGNYRHLSEKEVGFLKMT